MSKSVVLPDDIYEKALQLAAADKVSVNDFISAALAEQLAAREYLSKRASRATREKFLAALEQIPDVEPDEHDRF